MGCAPPLEPGYLDGSPVGLAIGAGFALGHCRRRGVTTDSHVARGPIGPALVKVLAPPYAAVALHRRRFAREQEILRRLAGLPVPRWLACGEVAGRPWAAYELLDGVPISERIRDPAPSRGQLLAWQIGLLAVVEEIHARGVVHRDIKPANVLASEGGRIYLVDFEAAASIGAPIDDQLPHGSLAYAAPEQGEGRCDPRSDLYSVGVMLFEMLSGQRPFGGDPARVAAAHVALPPPPLADLLPGASRALGEVVATALAKRPEDRFPDARTMRAALAALPEAR